MRNVALPGPDPKSRAAVVDLEFVRMEANVCVTQVEILQLENNLNAARKRLGEMRKISYLE